MNWYDWLLRPEVLLPLILIGYFFCLTFKEQYRRWKKPKQDSLQFEYDAFRVDHQRFAKEEAVIQIKDEIERNRQTIERLQKRNNELNEALERGI